MGAPGGGAGPGGSWRSDVRRILRLGWPQSVNLIITFLPGLGMLFFLGADPDHTAAAGMGFMFTNVAGFSLIVGSGAGAQPLISQAFGAGSLRRCGDLLQRQLAMHAALCGCIALVWLSTERILLALKQPPGIAQLAGQFVQWRVAALPALAVREDLSNYLVAQRVTMFPMLLSVAAGVLNMAAFAALIPRMGFVGAPLAYTVANVAQAVVLWLFARCALADGDTWPQWSVREALSGWGEMLALALPGGVLMLCEWWGWETNLFFAGLLCDPRGNGGGEHGCLAIKKSRASPG
ncbi:unnamed protein product [Prorocentrum cordatum]|uniref:Protein DETOXIFICATION n=1 Tax=Prorocentrum cordatum TaxID=2364126 RepID=A0ABN9RYH0_9DINO|nr:unnamed protein product [Polarella glacialis]